MYPDSGPDRFVNAGTALSGGNHLSDFYDALAEEMRFKRNALVKAFCEFESLDMAEASDQLKAALRTMIVLRVCRFMHDNPTGKLFAQRTHFPNSYDPQEEELDAARDKIVQQMAIWPATMDLSDEQRAALIGTFEAFIGADLGRIEHRIRYVESTQSRLLHGKAPIPLHTYLCDHARGRKVIAYPHELVGQVEEQCLDQLSIMMGTNTADIPETILDAMSDFSVNLCNSYWWDPESHMVHASDAMSDPNAVMNLYKSQAALLAALADAPQTLDADAANSFLRSFENALHTRITGYMLEHNMQINEPEGTFLRTHATRGDAHSTARSY